MYEAFITGVTGFVGFHLAKKLLSLGFIVHGTDTPQKSFDSIKAMRKKLLLEMGVAIHSVDIEHLNTLAPLFIEKKFSHFFHLAAREKVRIEGFSDGTLASQDLVNFIKMLEFVKQFHPMKLLFASSSEVYGNSPSPLQENALPSSPVTLFGATKASSELLAYSYHYLYGIDVVGLRFFTLYGPYGRSDMPYFLFAKAIVEQTPISLVKYRDSTRDFLYIDDAVDAIVDSMSLSGFQLLNIGSGKKEKVSTFLSFLEKQLGQRTEVLTRDIPSEEIIQGEADLTKAKMLINFSPKIPLEKGIEKFVEWFKMQSKI